MLTLQCLDHPENGRKLKIQVAAAMANVEISTDNSFKFGETDAKPSYIRNCHPLGRSPVLQTEDGYLFESNAILRYIARIATPPTGPGACMISLYGRTAYESSLIDSWLDFEASELNPPVMELVTNLLMKRTVDSRDTLASIENALKGLEIWLENRTFLVGDRLSIADIAVAFNINFLIRLTAEAVFVETAIKTHKGIWRLYNTVMHHPTTIQVLTTVGSTFGLPVKKPAEASTKKAPAASSSKKAPAKKTKTEDGEEDDDEANKPPPKKTNPLDLLPPSSFILDEFKKEYSNTDTRSAAAPWFFSHFDPNGFTCFFAKYKYNEDFNKQFMTANYVRGWFQRMEGHRKYAFGVALILGTEEQHEISSFWVFRGKGMPESLKDVEDTVLFDWTEISDIQAEKEKITDYLCWEGPTLEKPVLEGRVFK